MYNLLIAEENEYDERQLRERLSEAYNITFAGTVAECLDLLDKNKYECLVLDIYIEEHYCFEVLDYVTDNHLIDKMPVAVIAKGNDYEVINKVFNYNISELIQKPFGKYTLVKRIDNIVNLFQQTNQLIASNEELKKAIERANEAVELKSRFLFNMSHDIRTPMNAIVGLADMSGKYIDDIPKVENCLERLMSASNHLLGIIDDIVDISCMEKNQVVLCLEKCNLSELVRDISTIIGQQCAQKELKYDISIHNLISEEIMADSKRLRQAFINILGNSVKFTEPGGVVSLDITQIDTDSPKKEKYIFGFSDNGMGMSESFAKNMFIPFERDEDESRPYVEGSGLGLAITKNIIDSMGGTIDVVSKLGVGTQISITLEFDAVANKERTEHKLVYNSIKACLVDYDASVGKNIVNELESFGVKTAYFTTPEDILKAKEKYDISVVHIRHNDKKAYTVLNEIKEKYNEIKLVRVTDGIETLITSQEDAVFDSFVPKPVFPSDLISAVNEALGKNGPETKAKLQNINISSKRVLVVDDNEVNRIIVVEFLEDYGIKCDSAKSGKEAINILEGAEENYYDVVLMDIQMPDMDGYETTYAIRNMKTGYHKAVPVIALTADVFAKDRAGAISAGMNGYLCKPFSREELFECIVNCIVSSVC